MAAADEREEEVEGVDVFLPPRGVSATAPAARGE
jgi:hypothetical protein